MYCALSKLCLDGLDSVFDSLAPAVEGADVVVICVPVLSTIELVKECISSISDGCVVTDVASTKADLAGALKSVFEDSKAEFVGSHPICGSEKTGIGNARADLYEGSVTVVTPGQGDDEAVARLRTLWAGVGSKVLEMTPEAHDRMIARTSHLPHLVASMLVAAVCRDDEPGLSDLCGSGFRDTTRIAAGSEEVWHDIVKTNRSSVARELAEFERIVGHVRALVEAEDFDGVKGFLASAQNLRAGIQKDLEG